jgi:endopeptidase Clp ATP-binding regulatory subunit ClpX
MSKEKSADFPSQKEIEKDISNYLTKKYGERIKIIGIHAQPDVADSTRIDNKSGPGSITRNFSIKPEELSAYLDEYVIQQDDAKAVLSTKICTHFNRIRHALAHPEHKEHTVGQIKNNVLLMGPTGVGKTYLVKLIAKKIGVPFIKGDATKFSETGYVGGDVEDLIRDLVREADDDLEAAQYGIIYIDEIDKISSSTNRIGPDISRGGVQRTLLKPMEETEIDLKVPHDPISQMEAIERYRATGKRQRKVINTRNILFIMSGAFTGLADIIKKRVQKQSIGFESMIGNQKPFSQLLKQVKAEDLIQFGFESEFVGRLPVVSCLDELSADDLYEILLNFNCPVVVGKKLDFRAYGIHIQFGEEAFRQIADQAYTEQTGARGLVSVIEKTLLHFEKKLPSTDIKFLAVTEELVHDPVRELERLLKEPDRVAFHEEQFYLYEQREKERLIEFMQRAKGTYLEQHDIAVTETRLGLVAEQCQKKIMDTEIALDLFRELIGQIRQCAHAISNKSGLKVTFSDEAIDWVLSHKSLTPEAIKQLCGDLLKAYEYGLELLSQKKKFTEVVIPVAGLESPDRFINELVARSFIEKKT